MQHAHFHGVKNVTKNCNFTIFHAVYNSCFIERLVGFFNKNLHITMLYTMHICGYNDYDITLYNNIYDIYACIFIYTYCSTQLTVYNREHLREIR